MSVNIAKNTVIKEQCDGNESKLALTIPKKNFNDN